jgi:transposase
MPASSSHDRIATIRSRTDRQRQIAGVGSFSVVRSTTKRTRGPNQQSPWRRNPDDGVSVLRLALDTHDPVQRRRLESMFWTSYQVRRAVQRQAQDACRAYWAATHERSSAGPSAVRERLGLSKKDFEYAAYAHLDAAPHLRAHVTKAMAMHLADGVWESVDRHLFRDASGRRHGALHLTRWRDFQRLAGRARSHTKTNTWETFRLHGTLVGHRAAFAGNDGRFTQPRHLPTVDARAWWRHQGPLVVVFSGLGGNETLALPVRLPTAPSSQAHLEYHLGDPIRWHKIDLVRRRDPNAAGGWRYEAHLMVIAPPYASPQTVERRARVAIQHADRTVGIDVNVSNLAVASHDTGANVQVTRVVRHDVTPGERRRRTRDRRRQRAMERSRRAMNRAQYQLSKRQAKRARRREAAGLRALDVIPAGPRIAAVNGRPLQAYRKDQQSRRFRRLEATHAWEAASAAQDKRDRARSIAGDIVATHGYQIVVEDVALPPWSASWGRAMAAFSPGMLVAAIDREARVVGALAGGGGGVIRAATRPTALSQHCPCGARVDKALSDRVHDCPACGLVADRDTVSAVLASFVMLTERDVPASARVDYDASSDALPAIRSALMPTSLYQGWQSTLSESTGLSARDGLHIAASTPTPDPVVVARRTAGTAAWSTRNEIGERRTTSDRTRWRTGMFRGSGHWPGFRDIL